MTEEQKREYYQMFEDIQLSDNKGGVINLEDKLSVSQIQELATIIESKLNMNYIGMVKQFHETFKHPIGEYPEVPDYNLCKLRVDLLQEELDELRSALDARDLVETFDALADLQYVLSGAIIVCGLTDVFDKGFEEVHRSNMSKACLDFADAKETTLSYANKGIFAIYQPTENGKYIITREADGKILKANKYSPANLQQFL